jgi:hypothetical protein
MRNERSIGLCGVILLVCASGCAASDEGGVAAPPVTSASLGGEHPFTLGTGGGGPWTVTAPLNASLGAPVSCQVGVQSTHAFQGAGHAGG